MPLSEANFRKTIERLLTSPLTLREIMRRLKLKGDQRAQTRERIRALAADGFIVHIRGARYGLPEKMNLVTGVVQGHRDGYGFVIPDNAALPDVFIGARNFDEAMHGDRVVCRVESRRADGRAEGRVIRVLDRAHETLAGRFQEARGAGFVTPFETRIVQELFIPPGKTQGAMDGQAVVARILEHPAKQRQAQGEIIRVLGDPEDPSVELAIVTARYHLRAEFPPAALAEAAAATAPGEPDFAGRLDLRNLPLVTIDGESAKDFDDAVYLRRLPGGGWELTVSIADVAHYVAEDSALDSEAFTRGTSVYFPGTVIPMLPFELSNDICSLRPRVDRLTMSAVMTLDAGGEVVDYLIRDSVIRTVQRMTYTDVAAIIERRDPAVTARYAGLAPMFHDMAELAALLREKRAAAGAIDFDLPEPEVILDVTGRPENIIRAERNDAHRLIEEFMLLANRVVARHLVEKRYPSLHRVHDRPDPLKIEAFREFAATFGYRFASGAALTAKDMQRVLASVSGSPEEKLITHVLLRSMKQARYSAQGEGHFALAFDHYTHFTSPIRRYPDLIVHRTLKDLIHRRRRADHWKERLDRIAAQCSAAERNADEAERDVIKLRQTQHMATRIGETFEGIISGVTAFGFFVELADPAVEGLVRLTSLHDDYYIFDERNHKLTGERTGRVFRLGDLAHIRVTRAHVELRQIDFEWLGEPGAPEPRAARPKRGERIKRKGRPQTRDRRAGRKKRR